MLNGAAELYFAQRWSVEANALYSKWPTFNKKKFWGASVSAGYLLPVTRHWAVEVGLKGGYRRSESEWYEIEWVGDVKHHWYDHTTHEGGFLPGVKLNVVYRFGKPNR